ncbi:MAG: HDIG domain-containing protein, partial [Bacteroidota bacterium]|nr:HDIG domain-containing protein [Bacteroidota bacterium]
MERNLALELLNQHVKNEKMIAHCLASEAVMRALAHRLGKDEAKWGLAGLLHDVDVEDVNGDPLVHGIAGADM